MKNTIKGLAWAVGVWVGGLSVSSAAYVDYRVGDGGLQTFNITWDGNTENALAGGISLTKMGGAAAMPASFFSVCTDIGGTLYLNNRYGYSAPTGFSGQDGLRPSWGTGNASIPINTPWASLTAAQQQNATAAVNAAADIFYKHQGVLTSGTLTEKSALQLAVWEALLDTTAGVNTLGLGGGRFMINSKTWDDDAAINLAATWISPSQVNPNANYTGYLLIPDPTTQYGLPAQGVFYDVLPMVPEAGTAAAAVMLLFPLGVHAVRHFRRKAL
jgi:hypothetical protein